MLNMFLIESSFFFLNLKPEIICGILSEALPLSIRDTETSFLIFNLKGWVFLPLGSTLDQFWIKVRERPIYNRLD